MVEAVWPSGVMGDSRNYPILIPQVALLNFKCKGDSLNITPEEEEVLVMEHIARNACNRISHNFKPNVAKW